jgi:menaquinol-cytochrome c reductase iron-sulfur subunit
MNDMKAFSEKQDRRSFLVKILMGLSALIAALVSVPIISALLEPLLRKKSQVWRTVGKPDDYEIGHTVLVKFTNAEPLPWSGVTDQTASWLRRISEDEFEAFSVNCAHLGCPVRWIADAELFLCPCHGGVYNKDGSLAAGPPPHGLEKYPVRVHNSEVQIRTAPIPITT